MQLSIKNNNNNNNDIIEFRILVMFWQCQLGNSPAYLQEFCCPTLGFVALLHSACRGEVVVLLTCTAKTSCLFNGPPHEIALLLFSFSLVNSACTCSL